MWESAALADFQGRWEEWKTCSWFFHSFHGPSFPQLVAFALRRFCGPIALFRRPPEPIRFGARLQNVSPIRDPVQQGLTEPRIRNHLCPLGKRQVSGHD